MKGIRFEIRERASVEVVLVDGLTARVGHAAHCDVRLPIDQAAAEHLLIEAVGDQLVAVALAEPAPTLDGAPITRTPIGPGAVIALKSVSLVVSPIADDAGGAKKGDAKAYKTYALAAVVAIASGYVLLGDAEAETPRRDQDVQLFSDVPPRCPYTDRAEAIAYALDELAVGDAKAERHPFVPRDGIAAVEDYDLAAACFHSGGDPPAAASAAATSSALRDQIIADFRARSLRLEFSLRAEDGALALSDVRVLLALTENRKGPYHDWLTALARQTKQGEKK
jgi:hypothetical protein